MRMGRSAWVVMAAFACCAGLILPSAASVRSSSSSVEVEEESMRVTSPLRYKEISFSTTGATVETYGRFLKEIRDSVVVGGDQRHGIPVMSDPTLVPNTGMFLLVALSNRNGQSVTFALSVANLNLDAYLAQDRAFYFPNSSPNAASSVFTDATSSYTLGFGNDYEGLQGVGGSRESVDLGLNSMDQAITSLSSPTSNSDVARSLLVVIQMVSEAARYRLIQAQMNTRIRTGVSSPPDAGVISLENNWVRLSTAIQNANEGGAFSSAVPLQNSRGESLLVDNANTVAPYIALILYVCAAPAPTQILIRPVVSEDVAADQQTCTPSVAPTRIVGRGGVCADIRNGKYNDGNPIQLWPCSTNTYPNQLWSLEADGTIRSNRTKCLTTYAYSPGSYVMIYNCATAVKLATIWHVRDDGTIINPQSGLVLTATSAASGSTLTVETNNYSLSQGWRGTNVTAPVVTSIVGFRGLCLRANGSEAWLEACNAGTPEQQWALYKDGSIRPKGNQGSCLTASNLKPVAIINISSCAPASPAQRWSFARDGTLLNLKSGLVLDVTQSNPALKQIIVYPPTGNPNQQWIPML